MNCQFTFIVVLVLCTVFSACEDFPFRERGDCFLPKKVGPCRALIPAYYFDKKVGGCRYFSYGGCQGNPNNFETKEECQELCENQGPPLNGI